MIKICFVGLGSIGKKHIKNIASVLNQRRQTFIIDAIRNTDKELPHEIQILIRNIYYNIQELQDVYDVIFITNPTLYHLETIRKIMPYARNMFIEKPVFHEYRENLDELNIPMQGVFYVACPLRYGAVIQELRKHLINERVYSVRAVSSSYLPDWRKGVDYREIYSAHRNMGGGVTLDLIHELDYIIWLFGVPDINYHMYGKYSDLQIDSDDLSVYLLKYKDKIVEIHVDYLGRESVRKIELLCRDYVIKGDLLNNTLEYVYANGDEKKLPLPINDIYMCEMENFLDMIEGKTYNDNDIIHANEVLKIALFNSKEE